MIPIDVYATHILIVYLCNGSDYTSESYCKKRLNCKMNTVSIFTHLYLTGFVFLKSIWHCLVTAYFCKQFKNSEIDSDSDFLEDFAYQCNGIRMISPKILVLVLVKVHCQVEQCDFSSYRFHQDKENCYTHYSCKEREMLNDYPIYYGTVRNKELETVQFQKFGCCNYDLSVPDISNQVCELSEPNLLDETEIVGIEDYFYLITKDNYCSGEESKLIATFNNASDFFNITDMTENRDRQLILLKPISFKELGGPRFRIQLSTDRCYISADIIVLPDEEIGPIVDIQPHENMSVVDGLRPPISFLNHAGVSLGKFVIFKVSTYLYLLRTQARNRHSL